MEERKKSGTARVSRQNLQSQLTKKEFAAFVMQADLKQGMTSWMGAHSDKREVTLQLLASTRKYWAMRELAAFEQGGNQTRDAAREARRELTEEAFGARILMKKPNETVVGWLSLSPEERQGARDNFDQRYDGWVRDEKNQMKRHQAVRKWQKTRAAQSKADSPSKNNVLKKTTSPARNKADLDR